MLKLQLFLNNEREGSKKQCYPKLNLRDKNCPKTRAFKDLLSSHYPKFSPDFSTLLNLISFESSGQKVRQIVKDYNQIFLSIKNLMTIRWHCDLSVVCTVIFGVMNSGKLYDFCSLDV